MKRGHRQRGEQKKSKWDGVLQTVWERVWERVAPCAYVHVLSQWAGLGLIYVRNNLSVSNDWDLALPVIWLCVHEHTHYSYHFILTSNAVDFSDECIPSVDGEQHEYVSVCVYTPVFCLGSTIGRGERSNKCTKMGGFLMLISITAHPSSVWHGAPGLPDGTGFSPPWKFWEVGGDWWYVMVQGWTKVKYCLAWWGVTVTG